MSSLPTFGAIAPSAVRPEHIGRWVVRALQGLVGLNVLFAVAAIIGGSDQEWRVFVTSSLITAACMVVAANIVVIERGRIRALPYVAITLAGSAFASSIVGVWSDEFPFDSGPFWKLLFVGMTLGAAATHTGLLSLPDLIDDWILARAVAYICTGAFAFVITIAILVDSGPKVGLYLVFGALLAMATMLVVLGSRVAQRADEVILLFDSTPEAPNTELYSRVAYCPICGAALATEPAWGVSHDCGRCGTGFRLEITQRRNVF